MKVENIKNPTSYLITILITVSLLIGCQDKDSFTTNNLIFIESMESELTVLDGTDFFLQFSVQAPNGLSQVKLF